MLYLRFMLHTYVLPVVDYRRLVQVGVALILVAHQGVD